MYSTNLQPRFVIPRCLIKDHTIRVGEGWTYHVTCEALDQLGNRVALYDGRANCIVSDEYKQEEQFFTSASSMYTHSAADLAPINTDFLDNFFSQPSEGIQLGGFDFDSSVQTCQIEEPSYLTDSHAFDSGQPVARTRTSPLARVRALEREEKRVYVPVQQKLISRIKAQGDDEVFTHVKQYDSNNHTQYAPSSDAAVDILANELLEQLPDEIVYTSLTNNCQNDFVADNNALIEILSTEKQITNEQPTIFFLEENSGYGNDLQCVEQETYQAMNDEVEKYMDESLDHISLPDCPSSKTKGKHACGSCDESFPSLLKLRSHVRIKHNKQATQQNCNVENFTCNRCNRKFSCRERWQSHSQAHTDPDLECPRCAKVLGSKASLKSHKKIHERKFSCEFCIRTYETDAQLRSHSLKKHATYSCKECDFTCRDKTEFDIHLESHKTISQDILEEEYILNEEIFQDDIEYDRNADNEEDEEVVVDDDDMDLLVVGTLSSKDFEGDIINFPNDDDVQYYLEENDNRIVESFEINRGNNNNSEQLESAYKTVSNIMEIESKNRKSDAKKKLTRDCRKCEKHFDRGSDYKRHSIEHVVQETLRCAERDANGSQVFRCRLCEAGRFSRVDKLKAHLRNHLKLRLYQCNKCQKTFSDSSNYSKHKKVHGTAVYQCDTCKRKFNTRKMIKQHMDYHKKTKPLSCPYCDKVCYFESTLKKHINTHHKTKGKGAFSCQNCYLKFPSMKHKWDHQWSEHGIRKKVNDCSECDAKFRKNSELKRHLKDNH